MRHARSPVTRHGVFFFDSIGRQKARTWRPRGARLAQEKDTGDHRVFIRGGKGLRNGGTGFIVLIPPGFPENARQSIHNRLCFLGLRGIRSVQNRSTASPVHRENSITNAR